MSRKCRVLLLWEVFYNTNFPRSICLSTLSIVQATADKATYLGQSWCYSLQDKHRSRNRMSLSKSQETSSFKVKIRHKNDAVRRLYWALINHERDTDMTATTINRLVWQPSSLKSYRKIHPLMISSDLSHNRDMTKKKRKYARSSIYYTSVAGYQ